MPSTGVAAVAVLALCAYGCGILAPTCLARQQRGTVAHLSGEVGAGEVVVHRVSYGTEGSQNDARITWGDQFSTNGPRLAVYATRAACETLLLPPERNSGDCAIIARGGWTSSGVASTVIVTHGRGNPEQLGNPPDFKLWVVGDSDRSVRYTIEVTYFYGPDC